MRGTRVLFLFAIYFIVIGCDMGIPEEANWEMGADPGVVEEVEPIWWSDTAPEALEVDLGRETVPFVVKTTPPAVAPEALPLEEGTSVGENVKPPCWNATITQYGDMTVASEADLESLANISQITGNLVIEVESVSSVSLECLKYIGGTLMIQTKPPTCFPSGILETVSFPSLEWVGGVRFRFNEVLSSLSFPALKVINGDWDGFINHALQTVELGSLQTVGGSFRFSYHESLVNLELPLLENVGSDIEIQGLSLTTLSFPMLTEVGEDFVASILLDLTSLSVPLLSQAGFVGVFQLGQVESFCFPALEEVDSILVKQNPMLNSFSFPKVISLSAMFSVQENPVLSIIEMSDLTSAQNVYITKNHTLLEVRFPALTTVTADLEIRGMSWQWDVPSQIHTIQLPVLKSVGIDLFIAKNFELKALNLPKLQSVGQDFYVWDNLALTDLSVTTLQTVGRDFAILNNDALSWTYFGGTSIGRHFMIADNKVLTGFCGGLTEVGGDFEIENNPVFDFFALPILTSIGGDLRFWANPNLASFMTPGLTTIEGGIEVAYNDVLSNMQLSALAFVGADVDFNNNYNMSECSIDALIAQIENREGIGGEIDVYDNGGSCE